MTDNYECIYHFTWIFSKLGIKDDNFWLPTDKSLNKYWEKYESL